MSRFKSRKAVKLAAAAILAPVMAICLAGPARAQIMLTPAGTAQGLSLTTFATGFPDQNGAGPLGVGFVNGTVLVADAPGNLRVFPTDNDNQNAASAPVTQFYGFGNAIDIAQTGGNIYMTRQSIGDLVQINNNGTFNQVIVTGLPAATGLVTDPANGHMFVSTIANGQIYDVDPIAKTKTLFVGAAADGLSISPDGKILYAEVSSHILGYDTTTKAVVFDSGVIPGNADGTALGAGLFAGLLFANTNNGQLFEINLTTHAQTLIATGGTRGDFVTVDPTNNTLLITQTDRIVRLNGASFANVPEPNTLFLASAGTLVLVGAQGLRRLRGILRTGSSA
jgi:sugar lactone lactonase YvrE